MTCGVVSSCTSLTKKTKKIGLDGIWKNHSPRIVRYAWLAIFHTIMLISVRFLWHHHFQPDLTAMATVSGRSSNHSYSEKQHPLSLVNECKYFHRCFGLIKTNEKKRSAIKQVYELNTATWSYGFLERISVQISTHCSNFLRRHKLIAKNIGSILRNIVLLITNQL